MGKAKKVRAFGAVKRMIAPTDERLKTNQVKAAKKQEELKAAETRHVCVFALLFDLGKSVACLCRLLMQGTTPYLAVLVPQRSSRTALPSSCRYQLHQPFAGEPY